MKTFNRLCVIAAVITGLLLATPAMATDQLDLSVGLKTLPLLTNKITGAAIMAVIYDPTNADSRVEAEAVKSLIDAGLEAPGGIKLTALMVSTSDLGKLSGAKIGFVTKGGCTNSVSSAAALNGVLTMSTDIDCVKAGKCILGIVSKPNVDIYYSKTAAEAAKISFSQVFAMLVNQV